MKETCKLMLQQFAEFDDIQFEGKEGIKDAFSSVTSALKAAGYDVLINEVAKNEYIPYARFNQTIVEKNELSNQLTAANAELTKLKNQATDPKIQNQLDTLIQQNNRLSDQLRDSVIKQAILTQAKDAIDADDVLGALNKDAIKIDENGNVTGVDTEISRIREAKPHWFSNKVPNRGGTDKGNPNPEPHNISMNDAIRMMAGRR